MDHEHVIIDAGTLEFSEDDLTATGLLIPYGVPARSNLGTFTFAAGDIELAEDLTGMSLNVEHKREHVVGAFSKVWEQPEGVMATFKYRNTKAGREAFEDGRSGKRKNLSAEVAEVRIRDGKALPGSVLFAAAQVERPAFAGATLLAAEDTEAVELDTTLGPDEDGHLSVLSTSLPADITVTTPEGDAATYTPEAEAPAEDNPEGGSTVTATAIEPGQQIPAIIPTTFLGSAPQAPAQKAYELGQIFGAMATVKGGIQTEDAETLLAALSDIKAEATGGLTTAGSGVTQPAFVGKLWQGRRYQRKYMDLATHLFGGIQLGGRKGFKLDQGTALVTAWNGNKTEIGSGTATTSLVSATLRKYGYAADVAREWYDLEGGADVLQAFFEGVVDSYAKVTDEDALKDIFLAASRTTAALDRLVSPATFPSVDGHDYEGAMGMVIQGIEAVYDAGDDASFAIVNPVAWSQILYTPKDLVPEYVSFAIGAGSGEANADGKVKIVKAPQSFFTGTVTTAPQVIVGAKRAIEFREQGTTPIQIDALDIAKGGIDKAVLGYLETFVVRPESLVLIGTKP